jgi:endonuclease G
MAPNADFLWSAQTQKETFRLSNMTPQLHAFNAGIWSRLEELTRVWSTERGEVFVASGPLYEGTLIQTIGANNVNVPTHFYKIIFDPEAQEALAFILPHAQISSNALDFFRKSVREVEQRSGLNFLSALFQEIQDAIDTKSPAI